MPTYEYACKSCGEHLEVVQSFKDDALTTCPACGGQLRKVFGSIGITFRGSGFYRTDSRTSASRGAAKGDGAKSGSESSGSDSTASELKDGEGAAAEKKPAGDTAKAEPKSA